METKDGWIGAFEKEEEHSFLSVDKIEKVYAKNEKEPIVDASGSFQPPEIRFVISQARSKYVYSRQAYTILAVMGDFGGFNDALVLICSALMGLYSSAAFSTAVAGDFKHRPRKRGARDKYAQQQAVS